MNTETAIAHLEVYLTGDPDESGECVTNEAATEALDVLRKRVLELESQVRASATQSLFIKNHTGESNENQD